MPRAPFDLLVAPALCAFQDAFPGVELEIAVEARLVDIIKEGYDAGLRYGNRIDGDTCRRYGTRRSERHGSIERLGMSIGPRLALVAAP